MSISDKQYLQIYMNYQVFLFLDINSKELSRCSWFNSNQNIGEQLDLIWFI